MSYSTLIKNFRESRGMTHQQFGDAVGVSRGAVQQWELGTTAPTRKNQPVVAAFMGISVAELMTEHATVNITAPGGYVTATASNQAPALMLRAGVAINLIEDVYPAEFSIPLLSWVRAGEFCEAPGQFTRDDARELLPLPLFRVSVNTFALQVVGDSMDAPGGYRDGEIVYIDPDITPTPGRDVLAKTGDKMTLKRFKVDDEGPYLLQLNGNRIIRPTDWHVCGVVVYAGRRC